VIALSLIHSPSTADETGERYDAVDATDLAAQAVRPQQIAHAASRAFDAQRYAARVELVVQLVQHVRAGKIDER
jgi:hypothetical protein